MKTCILALALLGGASVAWAAAGTDGDPSALPEMKIIGKPDNPALIEQVLPEYPYDLRRASEQGRVSVVMDVDRAGHVTAVKVLDSDNPLLADAAVAAVRRWKFVEADPRMTHEFRHATVTFSFELVSPARVSATLRWSGGSSS
ncbi:MAG: TonB family protein [Opitutaceae bacterium]|nr:TonB family protein [Opitutaceae bacterium]